MTSSYFRHYKNFNLTIYNYLEIIIYNGWVLVFKRSQSFYIEIEERLMEL